MIYSAFASSSVAANGNGPVRVALYIRVSRDEQAERGYSIPEQRRDLMDYVEREGWRVVDEITDDGYSGAVGIRPGLARITELAEAGEIDVVLAKKRNRFFRSRFIRMGFERQMKEYGVRLVALDDSGHRFADAMSDEFADWYREEVTKNTIAGRMEKARQGKVIATHTPIYGFEYTADRCGFVVRPDRMRVVERAIREIAEGSTIYGAKRSLERDGIPAPKGGALWGEKTIREIVLEDAYRPVPYSYLEPLLTPEALSRLDEGGEYGLVWYPKRKITTLEPDAARGYKRSQRTAYHERNAQVPIPVVSSGIEAEMIDAAREAIANNRPSRRTHNRAYQLAGIIRCAECGHLMNTNRKVSGKREYFYYRCPQHQRDGDAGCAMARGFPAERTERRVLHAVLDAVKSQDELIRKAEESFEAERRTLMGATGAEAAEWRWRLESVERQRANYQRAFAADAISLDDLQERSGELDREKVHLKRLLEEHEGREEKLRKLESARDKAIGQIRQGKWAELGITTPEARRARYREIGLQATGENSGTVRLSWGVGQEAMIMCANNPNWSVGTGTTASRPP